MKFALAIPALDNYPAAMAPWETDAGGSEILRFAQAADRLSWDWLTTAEHIAMPTDRSEVMGRRFPEGLTACAVLAGATQRIHFLTYVLVLPYRHPVMLAKQIATLEFIAGGRFTLGTAVGHLEQEFEVLGIPFHERGKMTDEYLAAIKECWTADKPSFDGEYIKFNDVVIEPKPLQKPYPPIFIGGNSKAAMRRAAEHGDGWIPWLITHEELPACLDFLREQPGFAEKQERFEIVMPTTTYNVEDYTHVELEETIIDANRDTIMTEIDWLAGHGVTVAQVMPPRVATFEQCLEWIEWFDSEIIPNFR